MHFTCINPIFVLIHVCRDSGSWFVNIYVGNAPVLFTRCHEQLHSTVECLSVTWSRVQTYMGGMGGVILYCMSDISLKCMHTLLEHISACRWTWCKRETLAHSQRKWLCACWTEPNRARGCSECCSGTFWFSHRDRPGPLSNCAFRGFGRHGVRVILSRTRPPLRWSWARARCTDRRGFMSRPFIRKWCWFLFSPLPFWNRWVLVLFVCLFVSCCLKSMFTYELIMRSWSRDLAMFNHVSNV